MQCGARNPRGQLQISKTPSGLHTSKAALHSAFGPNRFSKGRRFALTPGFSTVYSVADRLAIQSPNAALLHSGFFDKARPIRVNPRHSGVDFKTGHWSAQIKVNLTKSDPK